MHWEYSAAGLLVGVFVGLTGMGGGSLVAPLLIVLFRMPALPAVGSGLIFAALTQAVGGWQHARFGSVDFRTVGRLALGSIPASIVATLVFAKLARGMGYEEWMKTGLALVLLLVSVLLLIRPWLKREGGGRWLQPPAWLLTSGGLFIGTSTAMTSVGSGSLTTALLSLSSRDKGQRVIGTVLVHAMMLTFIAGLTHLAFGSVDLALTAALLLGSIPGVVIGSRVSHLLPEAKVQTCLASALLLLSLLMLAPEGLRPGGIDPLHGAVRVLSPEPAVEAIVEPIEPAPLFVETKMEERRRPSTPVID